MPVNQRHGRRQAVSLGGTSTEASAPLPTNTLILASNPASFSYTSIPSSSSPTPSPSSTPSPTPSSDSAAAVKSDSIAISTVVGACVGAFIGLALLICLFIWWSGRSSSKARRSPRSPVADHRSARGEDDQERGRSDAWNKLEDGAMPPITRQMTQQEVDEKNFSMFKKRSNSTRTTKTAKALEEHGFDMPPLELSKYHPHLAEELALQSPDKPFGQRQENGLSGVSWDGETVGDDSFLSLRSVRIESGAMSPTMSMAKVTPTAMSPLHRWESAEVLSMDEPSVHSSHIPQANPFADAVVEEHTLERRKSNVNPFFGSSDTTAYQMNRRRSRSGSRTRRSPSRDAHHARTSMRATVVSQISEGGNPFEDLSYTVEPPAQDYGHERHDSVASGASGEVFSASHRAMESLIAALDISQDEVQDRLRTASLQPSVSSRHSSILYGEETDIGIARDYPPTPTMPTTSQHVRP